jgi:peroxiredoxin
MPVNERDLPRVTPLARIMAAMLTVGVQAPELDSVVDQDGNPVRLADLRGQWVLLWWYPMADTPG